MAKKFCVFSFYILLSLVKLSLTFPVKSEELEVIGPKVFLTVSSDGTIEQDEKNVTTKIISRRFILNWSGLDDAAKTSTFIGLFDKDPTTFPPKELRSNAVHFVSAVESGQAVTPIKYVGKDKTTFSENCAGFWITHFSESRLFLTKCFTIYPTWMNELKEVIGNRALHSIMIPGTHNSGSWREYEGPRNNDVFSNFIIWYDKFYRDLLFCPPLQFFCVSQEDSIYTQLVHGIRYLDMRIAHYPETPERFWVNHDALPVRSFPEIVKDLKKFVIESGEIVFLDFHRFPAGFNESVHQKFVQFLEEEIGSYLVPKSLKSSNLTFNDVWKAGRNIIVSYGDLGVASKNDLFWPQVTHAWADARNTKDLEAFLQDSIRTRGCRNNLWAAMAEITVSIVEILDQPNFGLRSYANLTNPKVTEWYSRKEWYSRSNIVATDFYLSSNLIEISVEANKNGGVCP